MGGVVEVVEMDMAWHGLLVSRGGVRCDYQAAVAGVQYIWNLEEVLRPFLNPN